jgi:hypothetical protein
VPFSDGDVLSLFVKNTNENKWTYQLFAETSVGTFMSSVLSLLPTESANFSALLTGLGDGTLTKAFIRLTGNLSVDRTAEYQVAAPVPIPPALALFGAGLFGLGLLSRKRKPHPSA